MPSTSTLFCNGLLGRNTAFDDNHLIGGPPGYLAITSVLVAMQLHLSTALFYFSYREGESAGEGRRDARSCGVHLALVGLATVLWMAWAMGMLVGGPVQSDSWTAVTAAALVVLSGGAVAYAGHMRMARADAAAGPRGAWMRTAGMAFWWMHVPGLFLQYAAIGFTFHAVWPQGAFLWPLPATAVFLLCATLFSRMARWLRC